MSFFLARRCNEGLSRRAVLFSRRSERAVARQPRKREPKLPHSPLDSGVEQAGAAAAPPPPSSPTSLRRSCCGCAPSAVHCSAHDRQRPRQLAHSTPSSPSTSSARPTRSARPPRTRAEPGRPDRRKPACMCTRSTRHMHMHRRATALAHCDGPTSTARDRGRRPSSRSTAQGKQCAAGAGRGRHGACTLSLQPARRGEPNRADSMRPQVRRRATSDEGELLPRALAMRSRASKGTRSSSACRWRALVGARRLRASPQGSGTAAECWGRPHLDASCRVLPRCVDKHSTLSRAWTVWPEAQTHTAS